MEKNPDNKSACPSWHGGALCLLRPPFHAYWSAGKAWPAIFQRWTGLRGRAFCLSILLLLAAALAHAQNATDTGEDPVDLVNPLVGTAAEGQTFPAAGVPFAMTQWTPETRSGEAKCIAPYYFADPEFRGFRASHFLSGSCAQDYGSFTVLPLLAGADNSSEPMSHLKEHSKPYRYDVALNQSGIEASVTGSLHAGIMRFRFPSGSTHGDLLLRSNARLCCGSLRLDDTDHGRVVGRNPVHRIYAGSGRFAGFSGHAVFEFNAPFRTVAARKEEPGRSSTTGLQHSSDRTIALRLHFQLPPDGVLIVRIGTSFTGKAAAVQNLRAEMPDWDLEAAALRARMAWVRALAPVTVAGNSPDRVVFYTALYHALLLPRTFSDVSGTYPHFGSGPGSRLHIEHANGWTYYCDFSLWDTFRAVHPLFTLLDPKRAGDMAQSLVAKGQQGGFLPIFPAWNSYTTEMTGDHADAVFTDSYAKGIRNFDVKAALRLMVRNATTEPSTRAQYRLGLGRRALPSYLRYGYIPLEDRVPDAFHGNEQVSRTLDYAFDDFEIATLATALGHPALSARFTQRAGNYRHVIDPTTGFARGRHADGSWSAPFDPKLPATYTTESTPYVATFFVPQDVPGLIALLGGPARFTAKLEGAFLNGVYDHSNEPSHSLAYLFDEAGHPELTESHVYELMRLYRNDAGGLPGNDDAGQMSAWYVFSALGFYPVTPGLPRYALGIPHFDETSLKLGGHVLHIQAHGVESGRVRVRSVRLNGTTLDLATRPWLLHSELLAGGELMFEMEAAS